MASPDASADLVPADAKVKSTILGRCTVDDDCLPALDHRAGFICLTPVAASKEDMAADPCLVPWWPDAICSTGPPPSTCVGGVGSIPATHSCLVVECLFPVCREGKCGLTADLSGAGCYKPKDCDSLRAVYQNTLTAAHTCFPWTTSTRCVSDLKDTCGCPVAYDKNNRCAASAVAAFNAWHEAGCSVDSCNDACPTATGANPTCVADAVGSNGTCQL